MNAQCSLPLAVDHGNICSANYNQSLYNEGDRLSYCCDDNYLLVGNATIVCTNTTWTDSVECIGMYSTLPYIATINTVTKEIMYFY